MTEDEFLVKIKGFSFDATKKDIKDFYHDLDVREKDINLLRYPDGRSTGYAFVRFKTVETLDLALLRDNTYMGSHYVSVTKSTLKEMTMLQRLVDEKKPIYVIRSAEAASIREARDNMGRSPPSLKQQKGSSYPREISSSPARFELLTAEEENDFNDDTTVIHISGLPTHKGYKDVRRFFAGCHIAHGGVHLCADEMQGGGDVHNGSAYVEFTDFQDFETARSKNGLLMDGHCINIRACSMQELMDYLSTHPDQVHTGRPNSGSGGQRNDRRVFHSSSERRVYHNVSDRRVHRNEGVFREVDSWPPPPSQREKSPSHSTRKDTISRDSPPINSGRSHHQRFNRDRSKERNFGGDGRELDGYRETGKRNRHHSSSSTGRLRNGNSPPEKRRRDSYSGYHHNHGRSSGYREPVSDKSGPPLYIRNLQKDWSNYVDTDEMMDPITAFEVLRTAGLADITLNSKDRSIPAAPLYTSKRMEGNDRKQRHSIGLPVVAKGMVLMEGLPYEATISDILDFFRSYNLGYEDVRIQCRDDGSPSGKAFVSFFDVETAKLAVQHLDKGYVGGRYVELKLVH